MSLSVALTAYRSEKYIEPQLDSIVSQLSPGDEVIVSCDPSDDKTAEILKSYCLKSPAVKLVQGPGQGLIKNFENALNHCQNDIVFLADHDDIWLENKVQRVLGAFAKPNVFAVVHDAKICDGSMNVTHESFMDFHNSKQGLINNIIRNSFIGCCMAFRREVSEAALPFPEGIPMHDQWLGLTAYQIGDVEFIKEPLLLYRRHDENMSSMEHSSAVQMLKWRACIIKNLMRRKSGNQH